MEYNFNYEKCIKVNMCFRRKDNDIILFWDEIEEFKNAKLEIYRIPYTAHVPEFWKLPEGEVSLLKSNWFFKKEDELYYCNLDELSTNNYNFPYVLENRLVLVGRLDSKIRLFDFKYMKPVCKKDIPREHFYADLTIAPDTIYMLVLVDEKGKYTSLPYFVSGWKKEYRDDFTDIDEM